MASVVRHCHDQKQNTSNGKITTVNTCVRSRWYPIEVDRRSGYLGRKRYPTEFLDTLGRGLFDKVVLDVLL